MKERSMHQLFRSPTERDLAIPYWISQHRHPESLFDHKMDRLLDIVQELLTTRGFFQIIIDFSSSRLLCRHYRQDLLHRSIFEGDKVFEPAFLDQFKCESSIQKPIIPHPHISRILVHFKRLRFKDDENRLLSASINCLDGMMGLTFSKDGLHRIDYGMFYDTIKLF
jgi:hypothetical protein